MSNWKDQIFDSLNLAETTNTGAGAVALTSPRAVLITDGADAFTLADGAVGQILFITMRTYVGVGTLTPTNLKGYSTITFNSVGDWVALEFNGLNWVKLDSKGVVFA